MITLTAEQLAEYRRIGDRLTRATAELRRAQARNDQERAARAERSLATAVRLRDDFCRSSYSRSVLATNQQTGDHVYRAAKGH